MNHRARLAILAVLLVGVGGSLFGLWHLTRQSAAATRFWDSDHARRILQAPQVEALQLTPAEAAAADPQAETLDLDGRPFLIVQRTGVLEARGISNVRRGLVNDATFDFEDPPPASPPVWQFALRFTDSQAATLLLFDFNTARAARAGSGSSVSIQPVAAGLEDFFHEQFAPPGEGLSGDGP